MYIEKLQLYSCLPVPRRHSEASADVVSKDVATCFFAVQSRLQRQLRHSEGSKHTATHMIYCCCVDRHHWNDNVVTSALSDTGNSVCVSAMELYFQVGNG